MGSSSDGRQRDGQEADIPSAEGSTATERRGRDFADVVELIKRNRDARAVRDRIHPSLRGLYEKAIQSAEAEQVDGEPAAPS